MRSDRKRIERWGKIAQRNNFSLLSPTEKKALNRKMMRNWTMLLSLSLSSSSWFVRSLIRSLSSTSCHQHHMYFVRLHFFLYLKNFGSRNSVRARVRVLNAEREEKKRWTVNVAEMKFFSLFTMYNVVHWRKSCWRSIEFSSASHIRLRVEK